MNGLSLLSAFLRYTYTVNSCDRIHGFSLFSFYSIPCGLPAMGYYFPGGVSLLKSCKICGGMHPFGVRCPNRGSNKKNYDRDEEKFRGSAAWKKKRELIRQRDGYMCRWCREKGYRNRDSFVLDRLSVHHIVPLAENFEKRLDDDNLITLCERCHEEAEKGVIDKHDLMRLAATDIPPVSL